VGNFEAGRERRVDSTWASASALAEIFRRARSFERPELLWPVLTVVPSSSVPQGVAGTDVADGSTTAPESIY